MDGERERMGRRPGRPLATLLGAGAVSNLGDGVTLAAAPLLAASVTRDPRAIGAVGVAWSLPWLLFALVSGAVVDRSDRRRLMVGADLVRVVGLAGLTAAVVGGRRSRPWWRCSSSTPSTSATACAWPCAPGPIRATSSSTLR